MSNELIAPDKTYLTGELLPADLDRYAAGDFVTRDGTDIHWVETVYGDSARFVCVIAPHTDWAKPGEFEDNLYRRYCKCNKHLVLYAKQVLAELKIKFASGWAE